ncbi:MAG: carbohydrate ABC transporter permease [Mycoplasmatales bacterium]
MKSYTKYFWFFVTPALILLLAFYILPILIAVVISFTDMDLASMGNLSLLNFIGFDNYRDLFTDEEFRKVLFNTFYYVIIGVPLVVIFSLLIATAINSLSQKTSEIFRGIYYLPSITNIVAVSFVWMFLYSTSNGLINYILMNSNIIQEPIKWLTDPSVAKLSLIILSLWKGIGLNMIIFLAAIKGIPQDYYEASVIDGANRFQQYFKITIPQLRYAIFFVIITTTIGWMQFFDEVFVMIQRESANAKSIALFIYENGFSNNNYGYASAASIILFIIILIITIVELKLRKE